MPYNFALRLGPIALVGLDTGEDKPDAHPVFASQMKRRLREGAKLIVMDPRGQDMMRSGGIVAANQHLLSPLVGLVRGG